METIWTKRALVRDPNDPAPVGSPAKLFIKCCELLERPMPPFWAATVCATCGVAWDIDGFRVEGGQ